MTCFIHQTDLFHPHGDPDDHWDLALVYALTAEGYLDLDGLILDYPPAHRSGDPAAQAILQMEFLSGFAGAPAVIGSSRPLRHRQDMGADLAHRDRAAAEWLCRRLQDCREPAVINIVGSCTDVAMAGLMAPELFRSRCRAVYINAGSAGPGPTADLEYNVELNPHAYAAVFDLPCPVYWCPCWDRTGVPEAGPNGTWYSFEQGEVFDHIEDALCNFFLYMLSRSDDPQYLRYLQRPVDPGLKARFASQTRFMWSTAAILHAAGLQVDTSGEVGRMPAAEPVFEFRPINISCGDDGRTEWSFAAHRTERYIFCLLRPQDYAEAMTTAMALLLRAGFRGGEH